MGALQTTFGHNGNPYWSDMELVLDVLDVYSVSGRVVATIVDSWKNAGETAVDWSGRASNGRTLSSGVYFLRLTAGERTVTTKMIVLR